jgi:hypothetical protein
MVMLGQQTTLEAPIRGVGAWLFSFDIAMGRAILYLGSILEEDR